jgi:hypothetical protein
MVAGDAKKEKKDVPEAECLSNCSLNPEEMTQLATGTEAERALSTVPVSSISKEESLECTQNGLV